MKIKKYKAKKWVKKISKINFKTRTPINYRACLHKTDKAAMAALQKIPFFDTLCAKFLETLGERRWNVKNMAEGVRITEQQCPRVYYMVKSISVKMGIEMPELYLTLDREPNAYTYGNKKVFLTITSGLLECLGDDELYFVLAHECGHIACNHVLYRTMATVILNGGEMGLSFLDNALITKIITAPLKLALAHWQQCSEFSADRAATVCCETAEPAVTAMMRLAGGTAHIDKELDVVMFMQQALEYSDWLEASKMNKAMEYFVNGKNSHPLLSVRALELNEWSHTEEFKDLVAQTRRKPLPL